MAASSGATWRDRIRKAFLARDEGELENVMGELPENAELHLHVGGPKGNGEMDTNGTQMLMDRALAARDGEMEEIWRSMARMEKLIRDALNPNARRKFRAARDAFKAPLRDARRARLQLRDEEKEREDEEEKQRDARLRDNGEDPDDKDKNGDGFRDPPEAGGTGNRGILPGFKMEAPPGTADAMFTGDGALTKDSAWMGDSIQQAFSIAEVLVPGVQLPTFDAKAPPAKTFDGLCAFRSKVIDLAWNQPATRDLIEQVSGGRFTDVKAMNCQQVRDLFVAVGVARQRENDAAKARQGGFVPQPNQPISPATLADMQKANAEFFKPAH